MAMALALACRILLQLDDSVRALVVRRLRRLDQWSMMKLVLGVLALARTLLSLRQIARTRGLPYWLLDQALPYVKLLPPVRRELESSQAKVRADLEKVLFKDLTVPRKALPASGVPMDELTRLLDERHEIDTRQWAAGTVTGAIYHGEHEHMDFVGRAYGRFAFFNPLHASLHPATRQMDAEVVAMVLRMYSGPRAGCGAFTTGGTESILMAMKAYRDWGRTTKGITNPNIVIPLTAHAAFDKARACTAARGQALVLQAATRLTGPPEGCAQGSGRVFGQVGPRVHCPSPPLSANLAACEVHGAPRRLQGNYPFAQSFLPARSQAPPPRQASLPGSHPPARPSSRPGNTSG